MSLYTDTIRSTPVRVSGYIGAVSGPDATAEKELREYNTQLAADIKAAVKSFPESFDAVKAAAMLDKAAEWGRKQKAKFGGGFAELVLSLIGRPVNTTGLQVAINKAEEEANKWRSKIPFFGTPYVYHKGANKEWDEVNKQVITIYTETGGLIGERVTLNQAKRELKQDLNPVAPVNIGKIIAIAAAVGIGGSLLFSRKG